ncbi:MAG TPA: lamin tail domain-containing protein [Pyrinomonadaceae bacterium]|nr:lamin tail domain-containing protein [Pyrinomonadaceae bacterium]
MPQSQSLILRAVPNHKALGFLYLFLLVLAGHVALFEGRGSAAKLRQSPAKASLATSPRSSLNSFASSNTQGSDDIQVVVTTYENGRVSSRVIGHARNLSVTTTSENSSAAAPPVQVAAAGDLVISQIYSNGGNPGSSYRNNYLEFFNRTNSTINFSGWRIYIGPATGPINQSLSFVSSNGINIAPHRYLVIRFGPNSTNGAEVPSDLAAPPDPIIIPGFPPFPPVNISPTGKVFITPPNSDGLIGQSCPLPNAQIVDFVGYGTTDCFEGTGPTATLGNTTAALRKANGCTDTDNNANDFNATTPLPRNRAYPANTCGNSIDVADFFVRQHYTDFLNRQPDATGLAFWTNEITICGTIQTCIEVRRINGSGAFFLSIEFQETGYLVYRTYKAAYGNLTNAPVPLRLDEFLPDTQMIGQGIVVNAPGWEQQLENNKVAFFVDFVSRLRFRNAYPNSLGPAEFVDALFAKAAVTPSAEERAAAMGEFGSATDTTDTAARARALRRIAENATLGQQERNRAFVLMQYFGYLRRNPNDAPEPTLDFTGYNFWLNKLNQFNSDYIAAEMVKAFITSSEYRQRFGP